MTGRDLAHPRTIIDGNRKIEMTERRPFTPDEKARLTAHIRAGGSFECPRCGTALAAREIDPPEGVSYVRRRLWLVCGACDRTTVLDRRTLET